jgi:hypothetical protein
LKAEGVAIARGRPGAALYAGSSTPRRRRTLAKEFHLRRPSPSPGEAQQPDIHSPLLDLPAAKSDRAIITERKLRQIAVELDWGSTEGDVGRTEDGCGVRAVTTKRKGPPAMDGPWIRSGCRCRTTSPAGGGRRVDSTGRCRSAPRLPARARHRPRSRRPLLDPL